MSALFLWGVPAIAVICLLLIVFVPRYLIPASSSSNREDIVAVISARNEIRKTAAQLLAGASFVLTFVASVSNFNRDFTLRTSQSADDLYVKEMGQVSEKDDNIWQTIGAFYVLGDLARQSPKYHYPVLTAMAQYLVIVSQKECKLDKDAELDYQMPPRVQLIARIFGDRDISNDYQWTRLHLDGACLSKVNWLDAVGLENLWMPSVHLIGADLRNAKLANSYFPNAAAGIDLVKQVSEPYSALRTWQDVAKLEGHLNAYLRTNLGNADLTNVYAGDSDFQGANFGGATLRNSYWKKGRLDLAIFSYANLSNADLTGATVRGTDFERADFTNAELVGVDFKDANLKDAVFKMADIANADFRETLDSTFTFAQLRETCVSPTSKGRTVEQDQPKLPERLIDQFPTGTTVFVPQCQSGWIARLKALVTRHLSALL